MKRTKKAAVAFGKRVGELRREKGLRQHHIARALGIHRTQASRIETGDRLVPVSSLTILADLLGVQPSALVASLDHDVTLPPRAA